MLVFALLLTSPVTLASSSPQGQDAFSSYMAEFNKSYPAAEEPIRRELFEASARKWMTLAAEHPHAHFGPTKFSDWKDEEFAQLHPVARQTTVDTVDAARDLANITKEDIAATPASLDWRDKGAVTEIRDQKTCGGCWAFSAIGNIEGAAVVQGGKALVPLSEQELLDCSTYCGSYGGYFGCNQGCGGGLQGAAMDDLSIGSLKGKGVDAETTYPFTGKNGKCHYSSPGIVGVTSWKWVDKDEAKMQAALAKFGPLAVSVDDGGKGGPWMSYKGGVLSGGGCSGDLNHGVTLVGYGTDKKSGKDYWLVKNSWGTAWGDQGYIMLERGTCQCGICKSALTAVFPRGDNTVTVV